ncbi:MAG TPA: hypothetical protein VF502_05395 [Stellaceae bacterium]
MHGILITRGPANTTRAALFLLSHRPSPRYTATPATAATPGAAKGVPVCNDDNGARHVAETSGRPYAPIEV